MIFTWKSGIKNDDKVRVEIVGIGALVPFMCFATVIVGAAVLLFMVITGVGP